MLKCLISIFFLICVNSINATSIYLLWDQVPDADLDHYNIYISQNESSFTLSKTGITTNSFLYSGLDYETTYSFTVTAIDKSNNESKFSNITSIALEVPIPPNVLPLAEAGTTQTICVNDIAFLDGSNSIDSDGEIINYLWTQTEGPTVKLIDDTSSITIFQAPQINKLTTLTFQLYVWDNREDKSLPDEVKVIVDIGKPVVEAGTNKIVNIGDNVSLDGSKSYSPSNLSLIGYLWLQMSGLTASFDENSSITCFVVPKSEQDTTYTFKLHVWDTGLNEAYDFVDFWAKGKPNNAPVANAGVDQTVYRTQAATLNGSQSYDINGDSITYQWTKISGVNITLKNPTTSKPTFTAPYVSSKSLITFRLTVSDGKLSHTDSVTITILNISPRK